MLLKLLFTSILIPRHKKVQINDLTVIFAKCACVIKNIFYTNTLALTK
jgi:hypothetical protein